MRILSDYAGNYFCEVAETDNLIKDWGLSWEEFLLFLADLEEGINIKFSASEIQFSELPIYEIEKNINIKTKKYVEKKSYRYSAQRA